MNDDLLIIQNSSRRDFLKHFGDALVGITILGVVAPIFESCCSNSDSLVNSSNNSIIGRVDVSLLSGDNQAVYTENPEKEPVIVIRKGSTTYVALRLVCKHEGCRFPSVDLRGVKISCQCHGSEYDLNGFRTRGPAPPGSRLDQYETIFKSTTKTVSIKFS